MYPSFRPSLSKQGLARVGTPTLVEEDGEQRYGQEGEVKSRKGQKRGGKVRKEQERSEKSRKEQERSEKVRKEQERSGKSRSLLCASAHLYLVHSSCVYLVGKTWVPNIGACVLLLFYNLSPILIGI